MSSPLPTDAAGADGLYAVAVHDKHGRAVHLDPSVLCRPMTPLEFRGVDGAALLAWMCPSLTEAEAKILGELACGMAISVAPLRRFIETHLPAVRAKPSGEFYVITPDAQTCAEVDVAKEALADRKVARL